MGYPVARRRYVTGGQKGIDAWHAQSAAHVHMFRTVFAVWDSADLRAAAAAAEKPGLSSFKAKTVLRC